MDRDALTSVEVPPLGPARIALDAEGFLALRPPVGSQLTDLGVMIFVISALIATLVGLVSLATGAWGGSFMCLVFASPAILSSAALPAMRRLVLAARGAHAVRCTPSELVVEWGGGSVQRIPLSAVRRVRSAAPGEVVVDAGEGEQMIELAADEAQTEWLVHAIRLAAERSRRIPEAPAAPAALDALRERKP